MLTSLCLNTNLDRITRSPHLPLTRVSLMCGPNGSGKSTVIEAMDELINGRPTSGNWTKDTAPILIEGSAKAVIIFSMEKDNSRSAGEQGLASARASRKLWSLERSHGQSNYATLEDMFEHPGFDVMVLDEPESALDLDGLLWLREKLLTTHKQIILATHSAILLSLYQNSEVSVLTFGEEGYHKRILESYAKVCSGLTVPPSHKRLKAHADEEDTFEPKSKTKAARMSVRRKKSEQASTFKRPAE